VVSDLNLAELQQFVQLLQEQDQAQASAALRLTAPFRDRSY